MGFKMEAERPCYWMVSVNYESPWSLRFLESPEILKEYAHQVSSSDILVHFGYCLIWTHVTNSCLEFVGSRNGVLAVVEVLCAISNNVKDNQLTHTP